MKIIFPFLFLSLLANAEQQTHHHCSGFSHYREHTIGANRVRPDNKHYYSSRPTDYVACKIINTDMHGNSILAIREPFISDIHPTHIRKTPFLSAEIRGNDAIFGSDSENCSLAAKWDFSKKEHRVLDYRIYISVVHYHPQVAFRDYEMNIDCLYFIPYHEDETYIYTLTWCSAETCPDSAEIDKNAILFPVVNEGQKRVGLLISPLLNITSDNNVIKMETSLVKSHITFQLKLRTRDKEGKKWILAWLKQKLPHSEQK
jgi:hypothetical protein